MIQDNKSQEEKINERAAELDKLRAGLYNIRNYTLPGSVAREYASRVLGHREFCRHFYGFECDCGGVK